MNENFDFTPFRQIWKSDSLQSDTNDVQEILRYTHLVADVLNVQKASMAVLDTSTMTYLSFLGDVENITGWTSTIFMEKGAAFFVSLMPLEDYRGVEVMTKTILDFVLSIDEKQIEQFRSLHDYKFTQPDSTTKRILQESIPLKRDKSSMTLYTVAILTDISNQKRDGRQHLRLTDGQRDFIYEVDNATGKCRSLPGISKREKEILQLLGRDFSNKQIAEKLFISEHTVLTHRRNLLRKFDMSDTLELINFMTLYRMLN